MCTYFWSVFNNKLTTSEHGNTVSPQWTWQHCFYSPIKLATLFPLTYEHGNTVSPQWTWQHCFYSPMNLATLFPLTWAWQYCFDSPMSMAILFRLTYMSMAILFRLTYEHGNTVSTHLWTWQYCFHSPMSMAALTDTEKRRSRKFLYLWRTENVPVPCSLFRQNCTQLNGIFKYNF